MQKLAALSRQSLGRFSNEKSAQRRLESVRWKGRPKCPNCGSDNIYSRGGKREGFHDCRECRKHFTVRTDTIFERSHVPLHKWIYAIHLLMISREGISSSQLSRELKITQKSAWFMLRRLRLACDGNLENLRYNGQNFTVEQGVLLEDSQDEYGKAMAPELNLGIEAILSTHSRGLANEEPCSLIMGDATKEKTLPKNSVDLIVTSPPYNVGMPYNGVVESDALSYRQYAEFSSQWLSNCYQWARSTGRLCVNISIDKNKYGKQPLSADITKWAMKAGWKYHATILWNEGNISRRTAWGSWKSASAPHIIAPVEVIVVLYKDEWKRKNRGINDITAEEFKNWVLGIWNFNGESGKRIGHEAPFPRELPRRCVKLFSFIGDTVLDPFSGSGTTMIESLQNGRNAIGIELEEHYCRLSIKRIEKECGVKLAKSQPEKAVKFIKKLWTV